LDTDPLERTVDILHPGKEIRRRHAHFGKARAIGAAAGRRREGLDAELHFILRDFEREGLQAHGDLLQQVCATIQATEPRAQITCTITPQYRNMRYWLEHDMRPVELALEACQQLGIEPFSPPTRGGTDGSRLTEMGVPTPNLFTGMQNIHGPLEWISVQDMVHATAVCIKLAQLWSKG
ncbi:MAG: M20/M25/M40 family metallo-hydrolase, partial [Chloroflexia bacterium]|nr:M20/M25/M40 family metallo-hydrolase [Chloroflexia bacterium]